MTIQDRDNPLTRVRGPEAPRTPPEPARADARAEPVPEAMRLHAASRLYQGPLERRLASGQKLLEAASRHGIDPSLMWGTLDPSGVEPVRQMVLAVPGSGRTAMLFLTPPGGLTDLGSSETQEAELTSCVRATLDGVSHSDLGIRLVQALPEPHERWGVRACLEGGMRMVGELAYMRRPFKSHERSHPKIDPWPEELRIQPLGDPEDPERHEALRAALEASYVDTRDCPELCGLRATDDVISSHRSTGAFDPSTWWLIWADGAPQGCILMTHCPDHDSVELVYLGLSPGLRGRGLGVRLLRGAIARTARFGAKETTCAVDRRNTPAVRLYERLGFRVFASRVALVCPV